MVELGRSKSAFTVLEKCWYSLQQEEMLVVETQQPWVRAIKIKVQESGETVSDDFEF